MRIAPMVITFWIFAFAISLFQTTGQYDYEANDFFEDNSSSNRSIDAVEQILIHPDQFSRGDLFGSIFVWVVVGGGLFVAAGALMRSDMVLLGGFLTVLVGMVITPVTMIYSWMTDELSMMMCPTYSIAPGAPICAPGLFITTLILGTSMFMYIMAIFEWWTSRPLTR